MLPIGDYISLCKLLKNLGNVLHQNNAAIVVQLMYVIDDIG